MRLIRQTIAVIALGSASGLAAAASADPALYSFADLYKVTVNGTPLPAVTAVDPVLRPVSTEAPPARYAFTAASPVALAGGYAFSIGAMPEPGRWLLVLSGLAAAGWVARRRLYSF
jgi:hypothetical protein